MKAEKLSYVYISQGGFKMCWYIITWDWLQEAVKDPNRELPIFAIISSNPSKQESAVIATKKSYNEICEDIMEKVEKLISEAEKKK
jgi:hypothetical protein